MRQRRRQQAQLWVWIVFTLLATIVALRLASSGVRPTTMTWIAFFFVTAASARMVGWLFGCLVGPRGRE